MRKQRPGLRECSPREGTLPIHPIPAMVTFMRIADIVQHVKGTVVCGKAGDGIEVSFGFSSDLMSDVLTVSETGLLLITGLANVQTIRTAMMSDIPAVLFVRNKHVTEDMRLLAEENGMVLVECAYSMFRASGILFQAGLSPVF